MDCGSVGGQRTQRLPGRQRLLFLPVGLSGRPGGSETSARRCLSALSDGLGALRPRAPAARGGVSRASPLLLLLLVPSPRLAAAAPRRQLGDWERSRLGYAAPPAGRSSAWRCSPGVAAAAGALPQYHGPAPALVSCRRGEARAGEERGLVSRGWTAGRGSQLQPPRGKARQAGGRVLQGHRHLPGAWVEGPGPPCSAAVAGLSPEETNSWESRALKLEGELSLSAGSLQLERKRRDFTSSGSRKLYFDTHALVCLLEDNGFATQQAEIIVSALVKILEANMDIVYKDMVTKMQQEITFQQVMSQIANVKKDMIILEKSEFSALRAENEKIKLELHQLKQQVMDEVIKVRTDTKLDFNLEKSRVKELYSLNEKKLLELRTEIVALHAQQDRALTQTDRKIETEVAGLKTMLESHKLDNIKYLAGSIFTCLTVALGFYRLWI
ncbi:mitochondrial calcium uniporter regulator 1 isoform X1 [Homo sapiens]|uniref:mitochondrial calcium uniporter regulator 1 isoform X1 n=1 Tax=Homo sapiens TaxID=9606 RepID=UPI001FB0FD23|nr:mitochondrial calcium uniporter regulator 1 isoform X1 [Homo sapiens]